MGRADVPVFGGFGLGLGLGRLGSQSVGGFQLSDLPGLAFWYRAPDVDDPDNIGQWTDRTPGGINHAIQAVGASKPRLAAPIESNGRGAVRFDGVDDFMSVTTPPDLSAGCTILTVYHVWTRTDFDGIVSVGDDATLDVDSYFAFTCNTAVGGDMLVFRDTTVNLVITRADTERINQGLLTIVDTPSSAELRDQAGVGTDNAWTDAVFGTPDQIRLGARQTAAGAVSYLEVDLYEVACWVPGLSSDNLDLVEVYVKNRYRLSTAAVPARLLIDDGGAFTINPGGGFLHIG